jgi:hypothetical protein
VCIQPLDEMMTDENRQAERDYGALVQAVHAADQSAAIIIATIPPPCPAAWAATKPERNVTVAKTRAFNVFLRTYAANHHYALADVERDAAFVRADYCDMLHFTRDGYRKIAAVMAAALQSIATH